MSDFEDEMIRQMYLEYHCMFNNHKMEFSHICIEQNCRNQRIGCQKCIDDQHNHQLTSLSHYLTFEAFRQHIQQIIEFQLYQYKQNEEVLNQLRNFDQTITNRCIQLIISTQKKLLNNFRLAEKRFDENLYIIENSTLDQMIKLDQNHQDDNQEIQELLQQIQQIGIEIKVEDNKQFQQQQFIFEEKNEDKCIKFNINENKTQYEKRIINLTLSPNGLYLACDDRYYLKIFIIKYHRQIINKEIMMSYFNLNFSNDSKFYFYSDKDYIYLEGLKNSEKRIFRQKIYNDYKQMIIFPFNLNEALITGDGKYFTIMNIQSRQLRTIQTGTSYDPIYGVDYDKSLKIISCGFISKILFYCTNQSQIIFQQDLIHDMRTAKNQVKFINQSQYIMIGNKKAHVLCLVNYEQKCIYFLKKFTIGKDQQLYGIINLKYCLFLTEKEILILDQNMNIIQKIKFPQNIQTDRNIIFIPKLFLICNQDKIKLMRYVYLWIENQNTE